MTRTGLIWVLSALAGFGCMSRPESGPWVRRALEANRRADEALRRDDRVAALGILKRLAVEAVPREVAPDDGRAIRQDACFRLAILQLEADRPGEARRWADRGLDLGRAEDLFTANLLVARGHSLEALGDERSAAADYHAALRINESLLDQALQNTNRRNEP